MPISEYIRHRCQVGRICQAIKREVQGSIPGKVDYFCLNYNLCYFEIIYEIIWNMAKMEYKKDWKNSFKKNIYLIYIYFYLIYSLESSTEHNTFLLPGCKYIVQALFENTEICTQKIREFKILTQKKHYNNKLWIYL